MSYNSGVLRDELRPVACRRNSILQIRCSRPIATITTSFHLKSFAALSFCQLSYSLLSVVPLSQSVWPTGNAMSSSYYSATRRSSRDHFIEPPSLLDHIIAGLPSGLSVQMHNLLNRLSYNNVSTRVSRIPRSLRQAQRNWHPRKLLNLPHLFVAIWVVLLLWGERWVFQSSIEACSWDQWERWVSFKAGEV
jgi:hypothetical protein